MTTQLRPRSGSKASVPYYLDRLRTDGEAPSGDEPFLYAAKRRPSDAPSRRDAQTGLAVAGHPERAAASSDRELAAVRDAWAPDAIEVEEVEIAPRKSDIAVKRVALAW